MTSTRLFLTVHGIGVPEVSGPDLEPEMWISVELFQSLLGLLTPEVALTFDDGFASCWDLAYPAMRATGIVGKFFVTTDKLGGPGFLTCDQVKELSLAGMTIGTHGMRHRPWRKLDEIALQEEVFDAKERLETLLGKPVTEAACPFGAYDRRTLRELKRSGIRNVYTSDRALASPSTWVIPRYTIRRSDTPAYIEEILAGKHDVSMMGRAKMLFKRCR